MTRSLILIRPDPEASRGGAEPPALAPLGSLEEVVDALGRFNTAGDGSEGQNLGTLFLYGPGLVAEIPAGLDSVSQVLVSVHDDEIAWPVLSRLCKARSWKMMDPVTGRTFG